MKALIIEQVSNGWIVKPFEPLVAYTKFGPENTAVYETIASLQRAIPALLTGTPENPNPHTPFHDQLSTLIQGEARAASTD